MHLRLPFITLGAIAAIASCGKPDPVASNVAAANLAVPANETTEISGAAPAAAPPAAAEPAPENAAAPAAAAPIPAALQGRWGLTPRDCTSALGDAKGLLVVNGKELRFYESRAVPSPGAEADSDSMIGNFRFTGEGQAWTKFERLELQNDKLVRTESNPAVSYTYAKC